MAGSTLAETADAAVSCAYVEAGAPGLAGNELAVHVGDTPQPAVAIARFGTEIQVVGHGSSAGFATCSGGTPRVTNIDTIGITGPADTDIKIFEFGGELAPGATDENDGSSEIEVFTAAPYGSLSVSTGETSSHIRLDFPHFINLNADADPIPDADVTAPSIPSVEIFGQDADDKIVAEGSYPASATLIGQGGADVLRGGTNDDLLLGGTGNDRLDGGDGSNDVRGNPGADRLVAARFAEHATLLGGAGPDFIDARNRTRDHVGCGAGKDKASVDWEDKVIDCERVLLPRN